VKIKKQFEGKRRRRIRWKMDGEKGKEGDERYNKENRSRDKQKIRKGNVGDVEN